MLYDRIEKPPLWLALLASAGTVAFMAWLRISLYPHAVVPLTYVLPQMLGLWHRDRRLNWTMAGIFLFMAVYKMAYIVPAESMPTSMQWSFLLMQVANIAVAAFVIDWLNAYYDRVEAHRALLVRTNSELETSNEELASREEEISRQNEELREQTEELEQQTEELRQQAEEVSAQSEELRVLNEEMVKKESALRAMLDISGPYSNETEALRRICALAPSIVEDAAACAVLERQGSGMSVRAFSGFESGTVRETIPVERTVAALVLERGETGFLDDIEKRPDLEIPQAMSGRKFRSVLVAPLKVSGVIHGVLEVYCDHPHVWSAAQIRLMEWMAAQCSQVWETVRLSQERREAEEALRRVNAELEQRISERTALAEKRAARLREMAFELTRAERQERTRLAKLLHDHLQQFLVAAKLQAGSLRIQDGNEKVRQKGALIDELLRQAIDTSRTLTVELSPIVLHEGGLAAGLAWLARSMHEKHDLDVELSVAGDSAGVDDNLRTFVFEAVRELLFNVVKHAGVKRAKVAIDRDGRNRLRVLVRDEGAGWDPAERPLSSLSGFGLFGLQQRVEMVGGELDIASVRGQGTRVTLCIPLAAQAPSKSGPAAFALPERSDGDSARADYAEGNGGYIRVLLVDDHAVVRQGLAAILNSEADVVVVGEAADGEDAIREVQRLHPDVVVMDISMPRMDGIEATRRIVGENPGIRVIGLSMYDAADRAEAIRSAGAKAYLSKDAAPEALAAAIRDMTHRATAGPARR